MSNTRDHVDDVHAGFVVQAPGAHGLHGEWYAANAAAGALTAQRCGCGVWRLPARYRCAVCLGDEWSFEPVTQRGTVVSWTVTHRPFHFGYAEAVPYGLVIAETPEGVRALLHTRPRLAAFGDAATAAVSDALIGCEVGIGVDEVGVPFAVLPSASGAGNE